MKPLAIDRRRLARRGEGILKEKAIRRELRRIERLFEADSNAMAAGRDEYITAHQYEKLGAAADALRWVLRESYGNQTPVRILLDRSEVSENAKAVVGLIERRNGTRK